MRFTQGNLQAAVDGRLISVQVSEIGKFLPFACNRSSRHGSMLLSSVSHLELYACDPQMFGTSSCRELSAVGLLFMRHMAYIPTYCK